MQVTLDYGRAGLPVRLPDTGVLEPLTLRDVPPLADPRAALEQALRQPIGTPPLAELARGKRDACVVICDITRPVPNRLILPPLLHTLEQAGIPRARIRILIATGLHRPNTADEVIEMVGPDIAAAYRVDNHMGQDRAAHVDLGRSPRGVPAWIDRRYVEAELKITTGLIEPHLMAGYSGGRKVICPGLAGLDTVRVWHGPRFLEHPRAECGALEGNPVHEENTAIARMAGCDFIVNVCIDGQRRVTWLGAGDMSAAWEQGVRFVETVVKAPVPEPVEIVVTSGAGYPLDATWYQAVKGLTGALPIVRRGGTIILAAACDQGLGSPEFQAMIRTSRFLKRFEPGAVVEPGPDTCEMDEWQLLMLARVLQHARVRVVSEPLPAEVLRLCHVEPADCVESALAECLAAYGPRARIAVIPKGPYVLPYVAGA